MQLQYYSYENNGNIRDLTRGIRATAGADPAYLQSWFDYDGLNRLKEFQFSDGLSQLLVPLDGGPDPLLAHQYEYVIDRFGNVTRRNYSGSGGTGIPGSLNLPVDTATNRLSGGSYDGLGNQVQIEQNGTTLNLNYLDQGHVREVRDVSGSLQYRYYYDAGGKRRIKAKASDGLTNFQEDASYYFYEGESLACQLDIGELVQEEEEAYQPKFLMLDHLGSTRAEITFEGTGLTPTVSGRYDYMPYGQFINVPATAPEQMCFTGKPRDPESGLAFFGARFYNDRISRWNSPDQPFMDNQVNDPQSWNLYSYVRSNPLRFTDNDGFLLRDRNGEFKRDVVHGSDGSIINSQQIRLPGESERQEADHSFFSQSRETGL